LSNFAEDIVFKISKVFKNDACHENWSEKGFVYFFFYLLRTGRNFSKEKRGIERERKLSRILPLFSCFVSFLNNK
jgi:hypothetical protein